MTARAPCGAKTKYMVTNKQTMIALTINNKQTSKQIIAAEYGI